MTKIRHLPRHIVSRISAGQVIESPAYAVKELVENAIDAQATRITVAVKNGGLSYICVIDNGSGMSRDDLEQCYKHYTTSKITDEDDITSISSFGFRGEALASLVAVADVTIQSREKDSPHGNTISIENGKLTLKKKTGMPKGTEVHIYDIFSHTPARRKFLKSQTQEFISIVETVSRISIAFPHISFTILHEKKPSLILPQRTKSEDRVRDVLGHSYSKYIIPLPQHNSDYMSISGFITKPQAAGHSNRKQYLYINKRPVKNKEISDIVSKAYSTLIEPKTYPGYVIDVQIPPDMVDVNIDPRKERIHIHSHTSLFQTLSTVIKETLLSRDLKYVLSTQNDDDRYIARDGGTKTYAAQSLKTSVSAWQPYEKVLDTEQILHVHNLFIIIPSQKGIILIDQHAAHERILYEQFLNAYRETRMEKDVFTLPQPITLVLSIADTHVVKSAGKIWKHMGFEIRNNGDSIIEVTQAPLLFKDRDICSILQGILDDIRDEKEITDIDAFTHRMISYLACRTAIKAGDRLTTTECRKLVTQLFKTQTQYTCPHGRPVMIEVPKTHLYYLFKRT